MFTLPANLSPDRFEWGSATSSFQIEGAGAEDGRLPCIWDDFCAQPGHIKDGGDGTVACDHYHRYADDIALLADLGFKHYRFSIAWPRVMHRDGSVNSAGIDFYKRLLDVLDDHGITPNATLYHWDLPAHIDGGWLARDTAYRFADYARLVARELGDRLPRVATFNEPWVSAFLGYDEGIFAPGVKDRASALSVAHHMLLAHGLALQAWRAERQDTALGIVLNTSLCDPVSPSAADVEAACLAEHERNECFLNPLFGREWPDELIAQMGSRIADRRPGDLAICAQPLDFIGFNYYTRFFAQAPQSATDRVRGFRLIDPDESVERTAMGWEIYAPGLPRMLANLSGKWPLPPIWITENGAADNTPLVAGACDDEMRCRYLERHIEQLSVAVAQGIDVRGYYVWSLLDNFEWAEGYSQRFGIVHVDYATQQRTPKKSALMLKSLLHG